MKTYLKALLFLCISIVTLSASARSQQRHGKALNFDHSHNQWTRVLSDSVRMSPNKTSSQVDYKNLNQKALEDYLRSLNQVSSAHFKTFSKKQQLAFYINAYNAFTVKLIRDHYPIKSIKDTGSFFSSPWKKKFFTLLGEKMYLDKIEHELVRGTSLGSDARIHFAFNCASVGCPALLNTAWTADKLEQQLDQAAKNFLKDHSRNWVDLKSKTVKLSNIFKWYREDFESKNYKSLKSFLTQYASALARNEKERRLLLSQNYKIKFSGYDWNLNSI